MMEILSSRLKKDTFLDFNTKKDKSLKFKKYSK